MQHPSPSNGSLASYALDLGPLRLIVLWYRGRSSAAWFHPTQPTKYRDILVGRA